ncbi:GTP cyclohydrolase II [Sphingomicrobium sp. XHP0239]|uniref:GTP cyclohydrolase II n=1 Tax=Sphingomicrobium maritimum TaxID=3133972 RepID=UPI0031CCAE39
MREAPGEAAVARGIAALRAGRPLGIEGGPTFLSLETATEPMLALLDPEARAPILMSGQRAASLGLGNRREAADEMQPVRVARTAWLTPREAVRLVDPANDFSRGPTGPLETVTAQPGDADAIRLLRLAGLLPAAWVLDVEAAQLTRDDLASARNSLREVARAKLPVDGVARSQMVAFRDAMTGDVHVALLIGDGFGGEPPLVRIHDECLTGDVFGSLKCDCGPQLKEALHRIDATGAGILLYLRQEGRGIGIANKLRAYALQDRGLDTVDANRRLGFADDERDFGIAAAMLEALGVRSVRLLTNNPRKVEGLRGEGISVERIAHQLPTNPHNADYIATKKDRSGHLD